VGQRFWVKVAEPHIGTARLMESAQYSSSFAMRPSVNRISPAMTDLVACEKLPFRSFIAWAL
jgi:hypothetical protein